MPSTPVVSSTLSVKPNCWMAYPMGMHVADLAALLGYFVLIGGIGVWTARHVQTMSDFIMPRRFGKTMMVFFGFGAGTHSDQAVAVAAKTYTNGASGIWYQWLWLFVTPFYWLLAPAMRRFRALTTADVFELRYGRSVVRASRASATAMTRAERGMASPFSPSG